MSGRLILALWAACLPSLMATAQASGPKAAAGQGFGYRVEINTEGRIAQVMPEAATPAELQPAMAAALNALRFASPKREGHPATGTTFVYLRACPVKAGAAPRIRYFGHGPRWLTPSAPDFPSKAVHGNVEGHMRVEVAIHADGHGEYVDMEAIVGGAPAKRAFRRAVVDWAAEQRFIPESLDGQPQAGVQHIPAMFSLGRLEPPAGDVFDPCGDAAAPRPPADSLFTVVAQP